MQFPAPLSTFVQIRLGQRGIADLALLGAVPYYMSDTGYLAAPFGATTSFAEVRGSVPARWRPEQGAAQDQENIEKLGSNPTRDFHTVPNLEEHF